MQEAACDIADAIDRDRDGLDGAALALSSMSDVVIGELSASEHIP